MAKDPAAIRRLFDGIAPRYDLVNSLLSLGQHRRWKARAARLCQVAPGGRALDVCAGTGDIALALSRLGAEVVALDFAPQMLARARARRGRQQVALVQGDALALPFPDASFDAAAIGFSLRNVASLPGLLAEMRRVVRPGGWVVSLETSQPSSRPVRWIYHQYLRLAASLAPLLSVGSAYRYLAQTIFAFPPADQVSASFRAAGLDEVSHQALFLGVVAIHRGRVPRS